MLGTDSVITSIDLITDLRCCEKSMAKHQERNDDSKFSFAT